MASELPFKHQTDEISTSSGYDQDLVVNGDVTIVMNIAKSFLASLSEIAASVEKSDIEHENILEIGCYIYRASAVIAKLAVHSSENANGILQCLTKGDDFAKATMEKLQQTEQKMLDAEVKDIIKQLEGTVNCLGKELSSLSKSAFRDKKYVEISARSLSEEIRIVQFDASLVPETNLTMQKILGYSLTEKSDMESTPTEIDIYSISTEGCTENSQILDMSQLLESLQSSSQRSHGRPADAKKTRSPRPVTAAPQYVELVYKSFICPLSGKIMDDPVTVQSGVTYERKEITEYFESSGASDEVTCPVTKEKLQSRDMRPNIALKSIIQEWKERDETARLKVIREALSIGSTDSTIIEALKHLQNIGKRSPKNIVKIRNVGVMPLVVKLLELSDRSVRCAALETIQLLAQEQEEKEFIGKTSAISLTIRMLSSNHQPLRHAALLLLMELSKSRSLSEKIGCVTGGVLILIQTKYNRSADAFASEAAGQVLKNMERCPKNIKFMAENGYLEPLLKVIVEGPEDRKLQMVTHLGEIMLPDDSKIYVARKTSPVLAEMLRKGNLSARKAVFKALTQISSHPASGRILVKDGVIGTMVQEMVSNKIFSEPGDSLKEALAILANILESGFELEKLMVNSEGDTMVSGFVVFNILYMINNSSQEDLNVSLIRILYHMAKSSKSIASVVSAVRESEVSYTLIGLLNHPNDEIAIATIKLLTQLLPHIGNLLVDRLCETHGQPEGLVISPTNISQITERQALSASFLAKVPHQNLTLNLALLSNNAVPGIIQTIIEIQRGGTRHDRYTSLYLEGLVGVLVRTTATLYEPNVLLLVIKHNFTAVLAYLLTETSSVEVLKLAATGLEKLSAQSIILSKPPQRKRKTFLNLFYIFDFLLFRSSRKPKAKLCITHRGVCFKQNTFCLIEARAVERLLACLEHSNAEVAEASLSAISTLLDDKVNVKQSVIMLTEMNAIQQILKAVRNHKDESLCQKAFWMLERFLMIGGQRCVALVSQDMLFYITVVTAFHHGDAYTRQMAEKILRYLNKMPNLSGTFTR